MTQVGPPCPEGGSGCKSWAALLWGAAFCEDHCQMISFRYAPERHRVTNKDHDVVSFLRRRFANPLLFVYRHKDTDNWVVSEWKEGHEWGWMMDQMIIGRATDKTGAVPLAGAFNRAHVAKLDYLFRGPTVGHRTLLSAEKEAAADLEEIEDTELRARKFLAKRTDMLNHPAYTNYLKD